MLIIALVLAVIGLAALVTAVVTSNELIAWVCIGASVIGVLLLIVDALRERSRGAEDEEEEAEADDETTAFVAHTPPAEDYPDEPTSHIAEVTEEPETSAEAEAEAETTAVPAEGDEANSTKAE
jgi:chemotaxis protein histidine kinase CheA